ncbi:MAG: formimidoylglutamase [Cyclobacteriaceae bacterium]
MYQLCDQTIWTGRNDPELGAAGYLWHHVVEFLDLNQNIEPTKGQYIAILGFESDEGVRRNNGRIGAKDGPNQIRKAMAKLAVHFDPADLKIFDAGNVSVEDQDLERGQAELAQKVSQLLNAGYFPILLGGGHEIAYGHGSGILDYLHQTGNQSLGIINIDAHFDVRTYDSGPHSGSPFRQLLGRNGQEKTEVKYFPIGINPAANQPALFEFMGEAGQSFVLLEEIQENDRQWLFDRVDAFIERVDHLYITLDLDAISGAFAPGVSAPAAMGLSPDLASQLLKHIIPSNKVISFDIAELNPKYDDGRTAKLAAEFIFQLVQAQKIDQG